MKIHTKVSTEVLPYPVSHVLCGEVLARMPDYERRDDLAVLFVWQAYHAHIRYAVVG